MNWLKKMWRKLTKGKPKRLVIEDEMGELWKIRKKPPVLARFRNGEVVALKNERGCDQCYYWSFGRCHLPGECIPKEKIPVPSPIVLAAERVRHEQLHRESERPEDRLQILTAEEHIELHRRRGGA